MKGVAVASFDAIVIGAGPGGEVAAGKLAEAGQRVAIVERERVGGECAYWACIPSKVLLRSAQPSFDARRVPGSRAAMTGASAFAEAAAWRTDVVDNYSDSEHLGWLLDRGVQIIRGAAQLQDARHVFVDGVAHTCEHLVIATGSVPSQPPIEGLADTPFWTNRQATSLTSLPDSIAILGGGAVGVELAQVYARYGSRVDIFERAPHLLAEEDPEIAHCVEESLQSDGVNVHCGVSVTAVSHDGHAFALVAGDQQRSAEQLIVAAGRTANSAGLNLQSAGVTLDKRGAIIIDAACKAAESVYAVGDVTGVAMFTHVAKYQGSIAAQSILGKPARARYDAVPHCTFTDPEIASAGMTEHQAREAGIQARAVVVELSEVARPITYYDAGGAKGRATLVMDAATGQLVGGALAAPNASEYIGLIATVIHLGARVGDLSELILPFPTFSEIFHVAAERLCSA